MSRTIRLRIASESDAARAVLEASRVARGQGWDPADERKIATVVSELVRNILKYATVGELLIEALHEDPREGVQIIARDRGPGIEDIDAAMSDHFSSGGTLGLGLPGVKRMMDEFEIQSTVGKGTTIITRKWRGSRRSRPRPLAAGKIVSKKAKPGQAKPPPVRKPPQKPSKVLDYASYGRPCRGERVSGDAVVSEQRENLLFLAIIDGLGHGPAARLVSQRAADFLRESWQADVVATLSQLHEALRGTIGAVAAVCTIDTSSHLLTYAGVGNTTARILGSRDLRLSSAAGTLGHQIRTPKESRLKLLEQDVLILHTDGVSERFEISDYPQFRFHKAQTIAMTLVRRYGKDHDDVTCLALRYSI